MAPGVKAVPLLGVVWESFKPTAKWPSFRIVDRLLRRRKGLDAVAVASAMPPWWAR